MKRHGEPLPVPLEIQRWDHDHYGYQPLTVRYGCPPDGPTLCIGAVALRREAHLIARRRFRRRAGQWGYVECRLSSRRLARLFDKDLQVTMRSRGRGGHIRSLSETATFYGPSEDATGSVRARARGRNPTGALDEDRAVHSAR